MNNLKISLSAICGLILEGVILTVYLWFKHFDISHFSILTTNLFTGEVTYWYALIFNGSVLLGIWLLLFILICKLIKVKSGVES